jgi:hypothetical protein
MQSAGVPAPILAGFSQGSGSFDTSSLTGVGDMGAAILASVPEQFRALVEPVIPNIVEGIHGAFSLAVGQTFWLGVVGAIVAAIAALAIKEIPLRATNEAPVPTAAAEGAQATTAASAASGASASTATASTKPAPTTD